MRYLRRRRTKDQFQKKKAEGQTANTEALITRDDGLVRLVERKTIVIIKTRRRIPSMIPSGSGSVPALLTARKS